MSNVIAFTPRPHSVETAAPPPMTEPEVRAHLEEIGHAACDLMDRVTALADFLDGAADLAPNGAPSLKALAAHAGQVVHLHEPGQPMPAPEPAPEAPQDEAQAEPAPAATAYVRQLFPPLPWGGAGNVISAAGCALFALVAEG